MSDIVERLNENIIADAFENRAIVDGALCERLIRERKEAAETIEKLREENWEHIARGYALVGMLPDETLVGEIQDARRIIGGIVDNLRAENEKLRAANEALQAELDKAKGIIAWHQ